MLTETFPKWAQNSNILSGLFYTFLSDRFHREHRAVLAGKVKFNQRNKNKAENKYFLARSIHRLEKGLLMRPRKEIFGLGYIEGTIEAYISAVNNSEEKNEVSEQLIWAKDVLTQYFSVIKHNDLTLTLFDRFEEAKKILPVIKEAEDIRIPKARSEYKLSEVDYSSFLDLCKQRRSVRWFLPKKVPRDLIDKAIQAAVEAPSACNRQPFEYYVVDGNKEVAEVSGFPMGTTGYAHSIQAMIIAVGHLDAYSHERDRHLIYIDASLSNMILMLSLETLGLASCPINWPDIETREKTLSKYLSLQPEQRPIMMIGVGFPDPEGGIAYSQKATLSEIRTFVPEMISER